MRMPFGKYRGSAVEDIPLDYLQWLVRTVDLRGTLAEAVSRAISEKAENDHYYSPPPEPPMTLIRLTYRTLALKWHPDRGGSVQAMQALNEFFEALGGR